MRSTIEGHEIMEQFYFLDDDRTIFDDVDIDDEKEIVVKDEAGNNTKIVFCVTRNTTLGGYQHIVYGHVLNTNTKSYRQAEFRIHKGRLDLDNIKVFIQAPPITSPLHFKKSR